MDTSPFLDHYQTQLTDQLLRLCTNAHALTGQLLSTPDLVERWNDVAASYLADAVPEIAKYPHVALGWMMYVGMGLAHLWDSEWERIAARTGLYALLRDPRGFDCLDEEVAKASWALNATAQPIGSVRIWCALVPNAPSTASAANKSSLKAPKHFISMCAAFVPFTKWALP